MFYIDKINKNLIKCRAYLENKKAAAQTTEAVLLLFIFVVIAFAIVAFIFNLMGDGESEESGGLLKKAKEIFESKQT